MLWELALRRCHRPERTIEQNRARRGRPLIDRENIACSGHGSSGPSRWRPVRSGPSPNLAEACRRRQALHRQMNCAQVPLGIFVRLLLRFTRSKRPERANGGRRGVKTR
ncbi:hypothetical protein BIWAKO_04366 [Bosea sp. BIWAKO-01]|nr:hypothetical protein BIWAKO_04366 [Bosea sp. BIWAKO-01]